MMEYDLGRLCFICLSDDKPIQHLYNVDVDNITYYDKLTQAVPEVRIKELKDDRLVCNECSDSIKMVYTFREKVLNSKPVLLRYAATLLRKLQDEPIDLIDDDDEDECQIVEEDPLNIEPPIENLPPVDNSPSIEAKEDTAVNKIIESTETLKSINTVKVKKPRSKPKSSSKKTQKNLGIPGPTQNTPFNASDNGINQTLSQSPIHHALPNTIPHSSVEPLHNLPATSLPRPLPPMPVQSGPGSPYIVPVPVNMLLQSPPPLHCPPNPIPLLPPINQTPVMPPLIPHTQNLHKTAVTNEFLKLQEELHRHGINVIPNPLEEPNNIPSLPIYPLIEKTHTPNSVDIIPIKPNQEKRTVVQNSEPCKKIKLQAANSLHDFSYRIRPSDTQKEPVTPTSNENYEIENENGNIRIKQEIEMENQNPSDKTDVSTLKPREEVVDSYKNKIDQNGLTGNDPNIKQEPNAQEYGVIKNGQLQLKEEIIYDEIEEPYTEGGTGEIPDQNIEMPDQNIEMPDQNIAMPDQNIEMPDQNTELPHVKTEMGEQNSEMGDQNTERGDQNTGMTEQNTEITNQKTVIKSEVGVDMDDQILIESDEGEASYALGENPEPSSSTGIRIFPLGYVPPPPINMNRPLFFDPDANTGDFECDICSKKFITNHRLLLHRRYHEKRPFNCPTCKKNLASQAAVEEHARIHAGQKPHACLQCPKRFATQAALRRHAVVHTEDRPYQCRICGKTFKRPDCLSNHHRVHTGERLYDCFPCNRTFLFMSPEQLEAHKELHKDLAPQQQVGHFI